jgi:hypothetical protein
MELTKHTLHLIRTEVSKDKPLEIVYSRVGHWKIPNSISESRICATIDGLCAEGCEMHPKAFERTAKRVVTTNPETDGATGRCYCGACGKSIDPSDNFCRRCGARLED